MTTTSKPTSRPSRSNPVEAKTSTHYTSHPKGIVMKLIRHVQLLNEALSRARMRRPQTANSEATRPARQITMSSLRREQNRLLGL
jgi:hypothetical protein